MLSVGRKDEAREILRKIAKVNNESDVTAISSGDDEMGVPSSSDETWLTQIKVLLGNRVLLTRLMIMGSAW